MQTFFQSKTCPLKGDNKNETKCLATLFFSKNNQLQTSYNLIELAMEMRNESKKQQPNKKAKIQTKKNKITPG